MPAKKTSLHYSILFLVFFLCTTLFAQKVDKDNLTDEIRLYWDSKKKHINSRGCYYTDDLIGTTTEKHGKWRFYDFNRTLTEERNYFRDRIHGKQVTYHKDRNIKTEAFFVFNVPDSSYKEWNENGTLILEGNYLMGSPDGDWNYYYPDGRLKKKEFVSNDTVYLIEQYDNDSLHTPFVQDGNGEIKRFYKSGRLKELYTFTRGLKTGPFEERMANGIITVRGYFTKGLRDETWYFYNSNGNVVQVTEYHLDTLNGRYETYFANGSDRTKGEYKNGKKHGQWTWSAENQNLEMSGYFVDGEQHGEWRYYFSSGELSYIAYFEQGIRSGDWTYYFRDGSLFKKGSFKDGKKTGLWITNYENGNTLMQGFYIKGQEQGEWKNYWENGILKNRAFFKDGELNGAWKSFSPEGITLMEGSYKKGLKNKGWKTFDSEGRLLKLEGFKIIKEDHKSSEIVVVGRDVNVSVLHGKFEAYSEVDHSLKASGKYKRGKKNGIFIDYYRGGIVPTVVAQYHKGKLHGLFQQFNKRGGIAHQIEYKDGLKDGSFLIFNSSGEVIVRKEFSKGRQVYR